MTSFIDSVTLFATAGKGGDGWLRINIGCPRSILKEALERLAKAFG